MSPRESLSAFELIVESTNAQSILAIAIGLVAGLLVVLLTRDSGEDDFDSELTDLEERKDHAVAQLRELAAQRDKIDPEVYERQRAEQERGAADALRERDRLLSQRKAPTATKTPAVRGAVWGAGIVLALGAVWLIVSPSEIPAAATTNSVLDPELAEIHRQLRANPADVDLLVRGAALLAHRDRPGDAYRYIERALQLEPEHPGALGQYAALLATRGETARARTILDDLGEKHPDRGEAWALRSMVAMEMGDRDTARASLEAYMKLAPEGETKERMRAMMGAPPNPAPDRATATAPAPKVAPAEHGTAGAELWNAHCALCHGADGRAQTRMGKSLGVQDMTTPAWQSETTDEQIATAVRQGVKDDAGRQRMQAFPDLTGADIEALIALIRSWR